MPVQDKIVASKPAVDVDVDDSTTPPLPPALQNKLAAAKAAAAAVTAAIIAAEEKEKLATAEESNGNGNTDKIAKIKEGGTKRADWDMFAEQDLDSNFDVRVR